MRAKNILAAVPVPDIVKLLFQRITVSRIAFFYFCFSLVYCIGQLVFQIWAFQINNDAGIRLSDIIRVSGIDTATAPIVPTTTTPALLPDHVSSSSTDSLLPSTSTSTSTSTPTPSLTSSSTLSSTSTSSRAPVSITPSSSSVRPSSSGSSGRLTETPNRYGKERGENERDEKDYHKKVGKRGDGITKANGSVFVSDLSVDGKSVSLNESCVSLLVSPDRVIHNTKREDVTFIAFQVWVMGMSVIALLNESIPHIFAAFITHVLATAWSGFQIWNTQKFKDQFLQTTTAAGGCSVNVLPFYWSQRNAAEVTVLTINTVFLIASMFFTYRLVKTFGWQTFKRIGASLEINRIYKVVLTFSIGLQLAFFCILVSMGLWVDFLLTTPEGSRANHPVLYKAIAIVVCIVVVPWMYLGWTSVRKESKVPMGIFILVSTALLCGWGVLFISNTFRQTFMQWGFFATMSTASCFCALMCTILGIVCFRNFDKGLKQFLNAQTQLPGEDFQPVIEDPEKNTMIQFPSPASVPPFEAVFSVNNPDRHSPGENPPTVPEYDQTSVGSLGSIRRPPPARMLSNASTYDSQGLKRSGSNGSDHSTASSSGTHSSTKTYAVAGSHHALLAAPQRQNNLTSNNAKRGWVIE